MTLNIVIKVILICFICFNMWGQVNLMMLALKSGPKSQQKLVIRPDYCAANLVFRRKIWGARDSGIPPRSTPVYRIQLLT